MNWRAIDALLDRVWGLAPYVREGAEGRNRRHSTKFHASSIILSAPRNGGFAMKLLLAALVALPLAIPALPVSAAPSLTKVGQCTTTQIKLLGPRLEGVPDSGDSVVYANGIFGISYERNQPCTAPASATT